MRSLLLSALALLVPLTACNRRDEEANADQAVVARTSETDLPAWLTHSDGTDPGRWLAGREAGRPLALDTPQVQAMRASLARAAEGFVEDRRMIANRTVQLGQMLGEVGKGEAYGTILDGLGRVAAARSPQEPLRRDVPALFQHSHTRRGARGGACRTLRERGAASDTEHAVSVGFDIAPPRTASRSREGILMVDDHPVVLQGFRQLAEMDEIGQVYEAGDVVSAYRIFHRHRPGLVIADLSLGRMGCPAFR